MKAVAVALLLALAACGPAPERAQTQAPISRDVCLAMLSFASDEARTEFMANNLDAVVDQAMQARLMFATHPRDPVMAVVAADAVCPSDGLERAYRLAGADAHVTSVDVMSLDDAARRISALFGEAETWTEQDAHACVARIDGADLVAAGQLMNALSLSGLRGATTNASTTGPAPAIFLASEEACPLTERLTRAALERAALPHERITFCADASYAACGWTAGPLVIGAGDEG
ncbi:MAG: hypothetical protein AB7O98_05815 [Hyphomonadaceae bacterium]